MIARHVFQIATDTGTWSEMSSPFMGAIKQLRWVPDAADTGGSIELALIPNKNDTGDGWVFFSRAGLGSDFLDTGLNVIGAGDRFKVTATPGGSGLSGRLYVWSAD